MFTALLAIGGYSLAQIAVFVILAIVVIGIVMIVAKHTGIPIPSWVWQIVGLVILAVVAIAAIRFVMSL